MDLRLAVGQGEEWFVGLEAGCWSGGGVVVGLEAGCWPGGGVVVGLEVGCWAEGGLAVGLVEDWWLGLRLAVGQGEEWLLGLRLVSMGTIIKLNSIAEGIFPKVNFNLRNNLWQLRNSSFG